MKAIRVTLTYTCLAVIAAVMLMPLIWLVAAAFKRGEDFFVYDFFPPPGRLSMSNFQSLFNQVPFLRFLINSLFVSSATVVVQLALSSLGGFALAKYDFRGKRAVVLLMLGTLIIPPEVLLAPLYELVYRLGLMDSYRGLIAPHAVSVFGMFLFAQSMRQVPDDLLQAGRVDGCTEFGLYWRIVMPVSRPMIGAFCLIAFMSSWNSFIWPLIVIHGQERFTLPLGLNQMVGVYKEDYGALMAGTLLSVLPVAVLFFALQKEFVAGLTAGAVKG
jgi:arabinooligosaccharide transport system permease protein